MEKDRHWPDKSDPGSVGGECERADGQNLKRLSCFAHICGLVS